jgi:rubrerythrin
MKVLSLLPTLKKFEGTLAVGYDRLAEHFARDGEAAALFARLAQDERAHVAKLDLVGRYAAQYPEKFQDVEADLVAIRDDLTSLREFLAGLDMVTLQDALSFVMRVEWGAAEKHTRIARACSNRQLAEALHDLWVADTEHFARISAFVEKLQSASSV